MPRGDHCLGALEGTESCRSDKGNPGGQGLMAPGKLRGRWAGCFSKGEGKTITRPGGPIPEPVHLGTRRFIPEDAQDSARMTKAPRSAAWRQRH